MTELVETVRSRLAATCLVNGRLKKDGCGVSMAGVPRPRVVVDLDKPGSPLGPNQPRCDYIVVANGDEDVGLVIPLEMKKGSLRANEAVRQLKAGACAAEALVHPDQQIRFRPTVAFGTMHSAERNKLKTKSNKIRLHGRVEAVRLIKCGDPLMKALECRAGTP